VIGRSIGNYRIVRVLGEGGMGTVYLAEHPMIGKRVAVKMLRPDLGTDPGLVSRFFQEAKAVNEIRHPNIVDISDFGHTEDGIVYFVMELLEGESLRDRLAHLGTLPMEQVVACSRQVVDALAAAHRVGIIHRDLKPDNIFLVPDGQVVGGFRSKLFDFGVAKLLGDKQAQVGHKTIDGAVVGTPFYMSPEQALCHEVSAAADIYAMGVVMYEMVTGTVPFHSEQLVILLNAILKQPAPPPSRIRAETPAWFDRLVLRCLEKDPEARPQTMEEVGAVLAAGATELAGSPDGGDAALGATMMAPAAVTPSPVAAQPAATARTLAPRQPTMNGAGGSSPVAAAHSTTVPPRQSAVGVPRQTGIRVGGLAKPPEAPGLVARIRAYLETKRVQRFAVPALVVTAVVVVASIFLSHRSEAPVTEIVPEVAPPPPTGPSHATVHLDSDPPGAEVMRLGDGRQLGTTPVDDVRPADGRLVNYRFRLAGHTDVQMPFQVTTPGRFALTAKLYPTERRAEARASAAGRASKRSQGKSQSRKREAQPRPSASAPPPRAAPVAQPRTYVPPPVLPPLGDRNPVRRLGR
jgi:tRNA A-37 threonylcarbamoyl transferase component Bud32